MNIKHKTLDTKNPISDHQKFYDNDDEHVSMNEQMLFVKYENDYQGFNVNWFQQMIEDNNKGIVVVIIDIYSWEDIQKETLNKKIDDAIKQEKIGKNNTVPGWYQSWTGMMVYFIHRIQPVHIQNISTQIRIQNKNFRSNRNSRKSGRI